MFQAVGRPVAIALARNAEPASGEPVVGKGARPHDLSAGVIVVRMLNDDVGGFNDRAHKSAGDMVGDVDRGFTGEETLH